MGCVQAGSETSPVPSLTRQQGPTLSTHSAPWVQQPHGAKALHYACTEVLHVQQVRARCGGCGHEIGAPESSQDKGMGRAGVGGWCFGRSSQGKQHPNGAVHMCAVWTYVRGRVGLSITFKCQPPSMIQSVKCRVRDFMTLALCSSCPLFQLSGLLARAALPGHQRRCAHGSVR